MDINRVANEKKLELCQGYFRGKSLTVTNWQNTNSFNFIIAGFALLPFMWVVNVFWFFESAFKKPEFDEQNAIKKCKYYKLSFMLMSHFPFSRQMWFIPQSVPWSGFLRLLRGFQYFKPTESPGENLQIIFHLLFLMARSKKNR